MTFSISILPLFKDISVLSPHYLPEQLPYREEQIAEISRLLAPSQENKKPRNLFIYGKTGTGKTSSVKKIMEKFNAASSYATIHYLNCRIYNSRYRIMQKLLKGYIPELEKAGFGLPFLYEKLIEILQSGKQLIVVLDEIDMTKDLDELVYTLTRVNDEVKNGGLTIVGISNKLSFKDSLDPRSKSSLYEVELVFPPYTSEQLKGILMQRVEHGFMPDTVEEAAINLVAAITSQESGDARYALKLLVKAGEMAEQTGKKKLSDGDVENARRKVEIDLAQETIATLPENHQLVLYAIAHLANNGSRYARLEGVEEKFLLSGEVYEEYERVCKQLRKRARSIRWYHEYLHDLEMLGLAIKTPSSKGMRGHSTLIRLGYEDAKGIEQLVKKNLGLEN
jgi:cell division control protein 6